MTIAVTERHQLSGGQVGVKAPTTGTAGAASSQHPTVTRTMLDVLADGGNAIDATIAGCIVQATVQQEMTNHAGSVNVLYWDAAAREVVELNATGTIVPDLAPFRPVPSGRGILTAWPHTPMGVIPGFMPAMQALFERYATQPWAELVEPAIRWAEEGHTVTNFEFRASSSQIDFFSYSPSARAHFFPEGRLLEPGEVWRKPELAETLRRLQRNGPDEFISGTWARDFVARANAMGWPITLEHMRRPVTWGDGVRYAHGDRTIVQLAPPERQALFGSLTLGILSALNITSYGHYAQDPEAAYLVSHALRRATIDVAMVHDPGVFGDPRDVLTDPEYHARIAGLLRTSMPKVDLTRHVDLMRGANATRALAPAEEPPGSCENTVVDADGNWVQMMNTLQGSGIPGEVVGGVPMIGSHATTSLRSDMAGWLTGGGRSRTVIGSTFVMDENGPVLSLGSPANGCRTVPLVISNLLDYGMDPVDAEATPRLLAMEDDYRIRMEARVAPGLGTGLARLGVHVEPLEPFDWHMGSFQMAWREGDESISTVAGARRAGASGVVVTPASAPEKEHS